MRDSTRVLGDLKRTVHSRTATRPSEFHLHMKELLLAIGRRSIEREKSFLARVRLAVKLLRLWGAYGNNRRIS